jgi:hypothetical protein
MEQNACSTQYGERGSRVDQAQHAEQDVMDAVCILLDIRETLQTERRVTYAGKNRWVGARPWAWITLERWQSARPEPHTRLA